MRQIAYKDTMLTLKNYKEPLLEVGPGGFGYLGAILMSLDGEKMQCHICGKLFGDVGTHSRQAHKVTVDEYKERFELARTTSLISESVRESRKNQMLLILSRMTFDQRKKIRRNSAAAYRLWRFENKEKIASIRWNISLETKNKRGTCPDQLLEKIREVQKTLGKTPSKIEFIHETGTQRFVHLIYKTFGSYKKAVQMAGLPPAVSSCGKGLKRKKYSDDELLEYLNIYHKEEGHIPTETDCRRGLIPASGVYKRHFGSLPKARELAGIIEVPTRWGFKK